MAVFALFLAKKTIMNKMNNKMLLSIFIMLSILSGYATVYLFHKAFDVNPWMGLLAMIPIVTLGVITQVIFAVLIYLSIERATREEK